MFISDKDDHKILAYGLNKHEILAYRLNKHIWPGSRIILHSITGHKQSKRTEQMHPIHVTTAGEMWAIHT